MKYLVQFKIKNGLNGQLQKYLEIAVNNGTQMDSKRAQKILVQFSADLPKELPKKTKIQDQCVKQLATLMH
jgi:hypothetical protein